MTKRTSLLLGRPVVFLVLLLSQNKGRNLAWSVYLRLKGKATVAERVEKYGSAARARVAPYFDTADVKYPPVKVLLLALKREKRFDLYAGDSPDGLTFICSYPILGASGKAGPKLREDDHQVPEGLYRIESLNPNSRYHLSLRVNYPNEFDRQMDAKEDRTNLGGDIFTHGGSASIGCLAMGDPVAEELFVLAAEVGHENVEVVLAPCDITNSERPTMTKDVSPWIPELYLQIETRLAELSVAQN